jgi:hypothetical protein
MKLATAKTALNSSEVFADGRNIISLNNFDFFTCKINKTEEELACVCELEEASPERARRGSVFHICVNTGKRKICNDTLFNSK